MKKQKSSPKKSSLQSKFLLVLLPAVVSAFLLFSLLFSFFIFNEQKTALLSKLDAYAASQASVLSKPLWEVNFNTAESQIQSMVLVPEVSGIRVKEFTTGTVLNINVPAGKDAGDDFFIIPKKIVHRPGDGQPRTIGQFTLFSAKSQLSEPLMETFLREGLLLLFLVVTIFYSAFVANRVIVQKPFYRLVKAMHQAEGGKKMEPVNWSSSDEFGEVIQAYNNLVHSLNRSARELARSEERFRSLVETSRDWIWSVDENFVYTYASPRVNWLLGYAPEELIGKTMFSLMPQAAVDNAKKQLQEAFDGEKTITGLENRYLHKNGNEVLLEMNGVPVKNKHGDVSGFMGVERDITRRREMENMMVQSEKMLSIGSLASGMAHEINNPLAGMMQNAQVVFNRLSMDLPDNEKAAREAGITMAAIKTYMEKREILSLLDTINQSGGYAAKLLQNILSFAQESTSGRIGYDLAGILDQTVGLARSDYDLKKRFDFKEITIEKDYPAKPLFVVCDDNKLQQAFLNILKNGAEAMHEAGINAPRLTLQLTRENGSACLKIRDNGPGMDQETCRRMFDPFFTTKGVDKGIGIGLSVAYFIIVENHKGEMTVASRPGKGTAFTIKLPMEK
ncbi:MAG: PAS domain S-box protein [Desulfobacteraceae bacterium]